MAVTSTVDAVQYTGTGALATYQVPFYFFQAADLLVERQTAAGAAPTALVLGTDYSVAGAGVLTGGTITLLGGNLASGAVLTIARDPALVQDTTFQAQGPIPASSLNNGLDLACMQIQAARTRANNAIQIPLVESLAGLTTVLPVAATRANQAVLFDANGNVTVGALTPAGSIAAVNLCQVVDTITALKALAVVPTSAVTYLVRGYSTIGDGGGGTFRWNSADTTSDNGGTVIALTANGSAAGRMDRITQNEPINAMWFGAFPNNSTDNLTPFTALAAFVNSISIVNSDPVAVIFPRGQYVYSGGLSFTRPVVLVGADDVTLSYSGSGNAVTMGPSGLTISTFVPHQNYGVVGITFTGGASMTAGIYFQNFITAPRLLKCRFFNFGNSSAYGVYFQSNNWDSYMSGCQWYTTAAGPSSNWVYVSGYVASTSDSGGSRLRMDACLGSHQAAAGIGVRLNGTASQVTNCKIEGFSPNIRFGSWANSCTVGDSYFETVSNVACFEYGDTSGEQQPNAFITGMTIHDCFVDVHNTDLSTTAYVAGPTAGSTTTGLQTSSFVDNVITNLSATREMVKQNTSASQIGNVSSGNRGVTLTHSLGGSIVGWGGPQGELPTFQALTASNTFAQITAGGSSANAGIQLNNEALTTYLQAYLTSAGLFILNNNGNEVFRVPSATGLAQFSNLGIYAQKLKTAANNGEIFEFTDGTLWYKNLAGTLAQLSN